MWRFGKERAWARACQGLCLCVGSNYRRPSQKQKPRRLHSTPHTRRPTSRVLRPKRESKFYAASCKRYIPLLSPSPISSCSLSSLPDVSPNIPQHPAYISIPTSISSNARQLFSHPQQRSFNPYTDNGGPILAISRADFAVIAGDTRQSEGYSIQTRYAPKVFRLCVDHPILAPSRVLTLNV